MRLFNSIRRKPVRWACIGLMVVGLCIAYPTLNRTIRTFFAERALRERNAELALDWLESIPEWNRVGQSHLLLAKAYRRQGKLDLVKEHLLTAWKQGVQVADLEREQWLTLAQSGNMREAEPHLGQLLQNPGEDSNEICEAFVTGYFHNYTFSKAVPMLAAWEADFPEDPRPLELKGHWFMQSGRSSEAAGYFKSVLKLDPKNTRSRRDLAICLRDIHEYEQAKTHLLQCLREAPNDRLLQVEWGELLLETGNTLEAKSVLQRLLKADPAHPVARFAMAKTLLIDGDAKAAVELLQQLHTEYPHNSEAQYSLALSLQASGNTQQAAEMFRQVAVAEEKLRRKQVLKDSLIKDPNQPEVRYEIAMISMDHSAPEEGLRWLLSVIDLDPRHASAHAALADYYHRIGKLELEEKHRELAEALAETKNP